jgi:transposase
MARTRPAYPPEFRREAVELVRSSGRSIPQIADELGVSPQSLRNWVKQTQLDSGERRDESRATIGKTLLVVQNPLTAGS